MKAAAPFLLVLLGAAPALAAECRSGDLPPGVRADKVPACRPRPAPAEAPRVRAGSQPGFIDLGNGTEVRISGRARIDAGAHR